LDGVLALERIGVAHTVERVRSLSVRKQVVAGSNPVWDAISILGVTVAQSAVDGLVQVQILEDGPISPILTELLCQALCYELSSDDEKDIPS
jgi:hypothetical protein